VTSRQHIPALVGLRFIAALTVLISHSFPALLRFPENAVPDWAQYLHALSGIGMPLFFVLSGFVIHYNYAEPIERNAARGVWNFFVARFARLYPLYIFCIAFEFAFRNSYAQLPASTGQALPYYLSLTQTWFYAPSNDSALIQRFWVTSQVSWSVSTEWFFYFAYPFICIFFLSKLETPRKIWWAIFAVTVLAIALLAIVSFFSGDIISAAREHFGKIALDANQGFLFWLVYFSPYSRIFEFILGCLCAARYMQIKGRPTTGVEERTAFLVTIGAILIALALVWLFYVFPRWPMGHLNSRFLSGAQTVFAACFGFAPFLAIIIFCCARYRNPIVSLLSTPLIVVGGEASYSLYMLHELVINAFRFAVSDTISPAVAVGNALMWLLTMLSAIGLSLVTWRLIEIPARRWIRRALLISPRSQVLQAAE
jgi:peptidoglycan/LPS O-acetylase OafA/YrhL